MRKKKDYQRICTGIKVCEEDGTYEVQFSKRNPVTRQSRNLRRSRDYDGKPITSLSKAKAVYELLKRELDEIINEDKSPHWENFVKKFISEMRLNDYGKYTVDNYELSLGKHTFKRWKGKKLHQITTVMIHDLFEEMREAWSEHTRKSMKKYLSAVFVTAIERAIIPRNPMPRLKTSTAQKLQTVLNSEEANILIQKSIELDWEYKEIVFLALKTGCRQGELKALKWRDVDFNSSKIVIRHSMTKDGLEKCTKTGEDRILPITSSMKDFLIILRNKTGDSKYVLPRVESWMKGEQARELRKFLTSIGIPEIRFHDLRASWATLLLTKGVPTVQVMALGGWRELKTLNHYVRLAGVTVHDSLDCIDDMVFKNKNAEVLELHNESRNHVVNEQLIQ